MRPARRRRPQRAKGARGAREAARPRPGERARDQSRGALGVHRGAGLSHRPLPRQAFGAEPDGAALRQRPLRAALAARIDRQHPDHAGRRPRRGHPRRVLQPHRRPARHDPEPCPAAAHDGGHGAALAQRRRRHPRREAEGAALAQALHRRERAEGRGARPVPVRQRRWQTGARLSRRSQGAGRQPHRDLRGAAHRDPELALGGRAVLPAHRQAPGGARRPDRRQLPADAAQHLPWPELAQQARHQAAARRRPRAAPARGQGRRPVGSAGAGLARPRLRQGLCREPGRRLRAAAPRRDRRPAQPLRAQRRAGRGLGLRGAGARGLAQGRRQPACLCRRHLGPGRGQRTGGARRLRLVGRAVGAGLRETRAASRAGRAAGCRADRASSRRRRRRASSG